MTWHGYLLVTDFPFELFAEGQPWNESGDATRQFLKDNQPQWEPAA